jgi:ATP-dependent helicase/nuclease subunit A
MTGMTLADAADRDAIRDTALDETLVVEAAAGTGKTTELVCRIVRVIATGRAPIAEIVAVTFTEKAAGELKLRLREALERARAGAGRESAAHLDAALRKLEEAHVSTIHGFCADLLRERPIEAGIDPLFQVMTEAQAARLFASVFGRWLQAQLVDPPEGVRRILRRQPWPDGEEGAVDRLRRAGLDLVEWRDFDAVWSRPAFARVERIDRLFEELQAVDDLLRDPASRRDALFQSTWPIRTLVEDVSRVEAVGLRDYDGLEARLVSLARHRDLQRLRKGSGAEYRSGVSRDRVWRGLEAVRASLAAFEMDADADLAALLERDLRGLVEQYGRAKTAAGVVDFLDLLLQARNLIRRNRAVRASFQQRFARIFVDEFQDTDPLQAEILMLLVADDPSVTDWHTVRPVPGKLFLVGDPKQSIYRFRRADVGVYRSLCERLEAAGARRVTLRTSFRARPNIQRAINAAFAPVMTGDPVSQQPTYVALEPARAEDSGQPSVVVLPVPEPYATQRLAASAIEKSLPEAVGAWIDWLVRRSGWRVEERGAMTPIRPGHICVLFRRFVSYDVDITRSYVEALEARGIPHLLVGGRSFHERAEVEALCAALAAIERPDDELSVFATLRGPFFGIGDEELLHFRHRFAHLHPFHVPLELEAGGVPDDGLASLMPIADALALLRSLHQQRNHTPVAATINRLLETTRVHVRFALEHSGEQVLANVLRVADLARQYEADGGASFRGFLEELDAQAETGQANEAPILEDASDGVRLMTAHKAKGLEFPVVILADITAKLRPAAASRYLEPDSRLCAIRLAGCAPDDLVRQGPLELERDRAEGVRIAYVAATRARDLLVIPAVGDEERDGWLEPLNAAVYPIGAQRRTSTPAPACPEFRSKDSVLNRPNGDPATAFTVSPGLHQIGEHAVVWWDPRALHLNATAPIGLRHGDLIVKKDIPADVLDAGLADYRAWRSARAAAIDVASKPSVSVQTVTQRARAARSTALSEVEVVRVHSRGVRPTGRRFGTLVHAVLAASPLDATPAAISELAASIGRALGATGAEIDAAAETVVAAFDQALFHRARHAWAANRCRREVPIAWREDDGVLLEGVVDLAFEDGGGWTVVDFKTDEAQDANLAAHRRQLSLYAGAVARATGAVVTPVVVYV